MRMNLVNSVQHLGIDHLFQKEIEDALTSIHGNEFTSSCLYDVALRFRLLREHGFWVSPANDPKGLLSMYNAAHLLVHGEPELEEAIAFARQHLELMSQGNVLQPPLAVKRALSFPLPRTFKRVETICYMMEYQQEEGNIPILLDLAKLDFNLLQHIHLKELKEISEWDESAISILPEYLKKFYNKLFINFKEFGDQVAANQKYQVSFTKKEFQKQSTYYLQEAEWFNQNHKPGFKDQLCNILMCVAAMVGWGDAMTTESFDWAASANDAVIACAKIGRFTNDIARGRNRGDVASSVECYMNENDVTSEVAFAKIDSLVEDEWKTTNKVRLEHRSLLPMDMDQAKD
uniref:Terpene synthase N-terminal domain-containing protein n=1 Tax=Leersia perrieri TaxID=77586 RepID=A0A0D9W3J9_9ORYZ